MVSRGLNPNTPSTILMPEYIGRFAPSPTGELHLGSLIAALASYLDAKAAGGRWLVRMEDLDPPREMPGAAQAILDSLQHHGFQWDGPVLWQSKRHEAYAKAIDQLTEHNNVYYCTCSRSDLRASLGVYNGRCRHRSKPPTADYAVRARLPNSEIVVNDAIQGCFRQQLQTQAGDVVIQRKDRLYAYQLAVVVDDAFQGITHVVRGADLLESTPRQIALQQLLGLPSPNYAHIPIVTDPKGKKLSKQHFAPALCEQEVIGNLLRALTLLNQPLPPQSQRQHPRAILAWAVERWELQLVPRQNSLVG